MTTTLGPGGGESVHGGGAAADGLEMTTPALGDLFAADNTVIPSGRVNPEDDQEPAGGDPASADPAEGRLAKALAEWVVVLVGAIAVALVLRAFLFQAFWIPSESMDATLKIDDRVLVNKVSYRLHDVNRGDVVVFERPDEEPGEIRDLIKRVIGLEGDTIEGRDNSIFVNGERLIEPYLAADEFNSDFGPTQVPPGEVFVMGDNRDQSFDSRFFGTVSTDRIVGRAFFLFWPVGRVGAL